VFDGKKKKDDGVNHDGAAGAGRHGGDGKGQEDKRRQAKIEEWM